MMMTPFRGFAALSVVGSLVLLAVSSSAFAPPSSTQSLSHTVTHLSTKDTSNKLFWMPNPPHQARTPRHSIIAYMSDSSLASTTAEGEPSSQKNSEAKGFFRRLSSVVPPAAERQKLIPLALMFFCILFNYTILRDTKDVLMVRMYGQR